MEGRHEEKGSRAQTNPKNAKQTGNEEVLKKNQWAN